MWWWWRQGFDLIRFWEGNLVVVWGELRGGSCFFFLFSFLLWPLLLLLFFFFFSYDFYFSGIWGSYLRVSVSRSLQVFYLIFFPWWCVCSTRLRDPLWNSQCLYLDKNVLIDFLFCLFFPRMTWLKFEENIYVGVVFPFFCF